MTWPIDFLVLFAITAPIVHLGGVRVKARRLIDVWAVAGFTLSFLSLCLLHKEASGNVITQCWASLRLRGAALLEIDMLSIFMAGVFIFVGLLTAIYSTRYMDRDTGRGEYYTLLLLMVAGMVGVAFAGDFFTFFLFWELMCLTSYVLVAFRKIRWEPVEAGFKYLIMSSAGTATVLFAMSILYGLTGSLNFAYLSTTLSGNPGPWSILALAMTIMGLGVKAAMVPFHTWLPDAHPAAPSSISAMLSGVVIKTGVYGLVRILILIFAPAAYSWQLILAAFAVLTMTTGNLMALLQSDLKRLLAFSSIGQIGYIIFGIAVASVSGLTGSLFHVMNHAISKALLFLCSGAFLLAVESRDLEELAGIGRRMKVTGLTFIIGSMALAGVPPLNGFQSEFMIVLSGLQKAASESPWYLLSALMILNILFSVGYYLRIIQVIILREPSSTASKAREAPAPMIFSMAILAVLCVLIGVYPGPFVDFANQAAQAAFNIDAYVRAVVS
ncbi:cation:proton antiporter [Candidatus Bathyarchaeota archaeon]|nr:cation:proton antiporter [Candidatus Bathyarchaeota archaeon]